MKRILLMIFCNFLVVPYWWFQLCYYARHSDDIPEAKKHALLRKITLRVNKSGRVKIDVHGKENIPKNNGYIFFPNHQGLFDVLAIIEACDAPFSAIAKIEAANVPLLKQVFAIMKAQMIDREDTRQSMKVIMRVTEEVKEGRNYVIFPEGTRSKKGNRLNDFKGGSFKSAMNAKSPIVPVAMIDAFKAFDTNSIKPVTVQIHFLEPLLYEEYRNMKSGEIAELVKNRIEDTIEKFEKIH